MNEYVATATAEKRLREVLDHRLLSTIDADAVAEILLSGEVGIEYKPRAKAVLITLPLPDKAEPKTTSKPATVETKEEAIAELAAGAERAEAVAQRAVEALGTTPPAENARLAEAYFNPAVQPGIGTFVPKPEPDNGYGVSFDDVYNVG